MPQLDADKIGEIIDVWFGERVANGPIARNTDAYNQAFAAKENLKTRFASSDPAPAAAAAQPIPQE